MVIGSSEETKEYQSKLEQLISDEIVKIESENDNKLIGQIDQFIK